MFFFYLTRLGIWQRNKGTLVLRERERERRERERERRDERQRQRQRTERETERREREDRERTETENRRGGANRSDRERDRFIIGSDYRVPVSEVSAVSGGGGVVSKVASLW